jgi:hypothetical protein
MSIHLSFHICDIKDFDLLIGYPLEKLLKQGHTVSGFSTAESKFISIVRRARMVSAGDNGIYIGSGLRGVIPYVRCVAAVFLS